MKITFNLKKGVKFHDGRELTADDVKYTYDSIMNKDNASPRRGGLADYFTTPDAFKVVDPYTIEFNYAKIKADTLVATELWHHVQEGVERRDRPGFHQQPL